MNYQRPRVADIRQMRKQVHVGDQAYAGVVTALQSESENRTGAERAIFFGEVVIAVARQPRVADPCDFRMRRDPFGDGLRVLAVLLHAQWKGLDTGEDEKGVERRNSRTEIPQSQHAAGHGKTEIAEGFVHDHAMVFRPWF